MKEFTIGDLGVFIGTVGGVVTSILIILQKSRCRSILWGCVTRELDDKNPPVKPVGSGAPQGEPVLPVKPAEPVLPVEPVDPEDPKTPNILMGEEEEEEEEMLPSDNLKK